MVGIVVWITREHDGRRRGCLSRLRAFGLIQPSTEHRVIICDRRQLGSRNRRRVSNVSKKDDFWCLLDRRSM